MTRYLKLVQTRIGNSLSSIKHDGIFFLRNNISAPTILTSFFLSQLLKYALFKV